jgi:glycosyltransferase involved in cell wall biosynthesis
VNDKKTTLSIILPCKNEAKNLEKLLTKLCSMYPEAEIIIVNDGSSDNSAEIASKFGLHVINHPYTIGNGAAIKSGVNYSSGDIIVFMDADGQHDPKYIPQLLEKLNKYDMAVGARKDSKSQASLLRYLANSFYNKFASWIVNRKIMDLTSGFRAVKASKFKEFLYLLPNGFSYPTTITISFFRAGYTVAYLPIKMSKRIGKSHIKPLRDGLRFLLIIFKIGSLYSPLKIFIPLSFSFFIIGISNYLYKFIIEGRFTNMSALLLSTSVLIFLIGLVSEQITQLLFSKHNN